MSGVFDDRVRDIYDCTNYTVVDGKVVFPDEDKPYRQGRAQFLFYSPNEESGDTKQTNGCFDGVEGSVPMFVVSQFHWNYESDINSFKPKRMGPIVIGDNTAVELTGQQPAS